MKSLKRNWLVISKLTWSISQILTQALASLKNFHFNGLLLSKVYIVWAKKVQGGYLLWHWIVMQNLKKNWLVVQKMTRNLANFHCRALKVSKLELWWDPFIQSRKCMSLKCTDKLCVMTMKNDTKFEEELICCVKTDMRNLTNFELSTRKSQKFAL